MRIEVVTGTDTDVGKTWGTAALAARALVAGLRVHVDKPVQTGVAPGRPATSRPSGTWWPRPPHPARSTPPLRPA